MHTDTRTLDEFASKQRIAAFGVPVTDDALVTDVDAAVDAARRIGYPVVVKCCGERIAHKTERGLVRLGLADDDAVRAAATELLAAVRPDDGDVALLVAPMLRGARELIAGVVRDPSAGPCVMVGIGGVFAEAIADVVFRVVPVDRGEAGAMLDELATQALLGAWRGEPAIDRESCIDVVVGLSALAAADPTVVSVDVNPLLIVDGTPVAVDALVEIDDAAGESTAAASSSPTTPADDGFRALFAPRGVLVAGVSSHPGKFGFVAAHNILRHDFAGDVFLLRPDGGSVLEHDCITDVAELPDGAAELVFVCTPAKVNVELLRACAAKGVRAAFVASAGYGESDDAGRRRQDELVAVCDELGILLAGPNGQGVVSTPASLCAQIVAPYPPAGRIAVASQSGNFVSSFCNYAVATGVGVSRAVSAGNAAAVGVVDYLRWFAGDPETDVAFAYVEGVGDGRGFLDGLRDVTARMPVVVCKGGATAAGAQAAASHTGSLAGDDAIFDGICRQAGAARVVDIEEGFMTAAAFATQPPLRGPRVAVVSTAGGWGVVTADAVATEPGLELAALPDDLRDALDELLPPRWSRGNPVDLAGGETRDTVPQVLDLVAAHPAIDAVVFIGMGIQSNQGRLERTGRFFPDHGLERICDFHDRQDRRYAEAAVQVAREHATPVLVCTELATTWPDNPGVARLRELGVPAFASSRDAVRALGHMWRYREWCDRQD